MDQSTGNRKTKAEKRKEKRKLAKLKSKRDPNNNSAKAKIREAISRHLPSQVNRKSGGGQKNRGAMYPTDAGLVRLTKAEAIAMCISLPEEGVLERFSSTFESDATAVAVPLSNPPIDFNTGATPTNDMPATDTFIVQQRVMECGIIQYMANTTGTAMTYQMLGSTPLDEFTVPYPTSTWAYECIDGQVSNLHLVCGVPTVSFAPHGNVWFAACDTATVTGAGSDKRMFWFEENSVLNITAHIGTATSLITADFALNQWSEFGTNLNAQVSSAITDAAGIFSAVAITVLKSGYYWLSVNVSTSDTMTIDGIQYIHEGAIFAHLCIPGFDANGGRVKSGHVSAASTQFVNTAPMIENSGNVAMYQTKPDEAWMSFVGNYLKISNAKGSYTGKASNGSFGYLRPDSATNFTPIAYSIWHGGSVLDSFWPVRQGSGALITYIQINDVTGRQGYYKLRFGLEYLTSDVWSEVEMPTASPKDWDAAIQALKKIPQFHENPLHLSEIWSKIKGGLSKAANFALQKGPGILKGIEAIMPLLGI